MAEPTNQTASQVRPVISLLAILTLVETFGNAIGGVAVEFIAGVYKYPVSNQLAGYITSICTIPLKLLCLFYAIKWGLMKIE